MLVCIDFVSMYNPFLYLCLWIHNTRGIYLQEIVLERFSDEKGKIQEKSEEGERIEMQERGDSINLNWKEKDTLD